MFISATQLNRGMGVDMNIARFFVDREPPKNNSFWKDRLLYVGFGNGYVSIPVYYDLLFRIGITLDQLLSEDHILLMEQIMHWAILQEREEISMQEEMIAIRELLKGRVKDQKYFDALNAYLDQPTLKPMGSFGLKNPALNRADVFLYVLCDLALTENQRELAIKFWYALHPTYLIIDDLRDYEKDKQDGEENVLMEWNDKSARFHYAMDMVKSNCKILQRVNPVLADFLLSYEEELKGKVDG
jgi:hypothetical protein